MKIIERYLSAYVVACLFGYTDKTHMDYVFQVLRESGSKTDHPVLSKVLDYVRQGDPASIEVQREVAAYVKAIMNGTHTSAPKSGMKAKFSTMEGFTVIAVYNAESIVGLGVARQEDTDLAIEELQEQYPGIQITQV